MVEVTLHRKRDIGQNEPNHKKQNGGKLRYAGEGRQSLLH